MNLRQMSSRSFEDLAVELVAWFFGNECAKIARSLIDYGPRTLSAIAKQTTLKQTVVRSSLRALLRMRIARTSTVMLNLVKEMTLFAIDCDAACALLLLGRECEHIKRTLGADAASVFRFIAVNGHSSIEQILNACKEHTTPVVARHTTDVSIDCNAGDLRTMKPASEQRLDPLSERRPDRLLEPLQEHLSASSPVQPPEIESFKITVAAAEKALRSLLADHYLIVLEPRHLAIDAELISQMRSELQRQQQQKPSTQREATQSLSSGRKRATGGSSEKQISELARARLLDTALERQFEDLAQRDFECVAAFTSGTDRESAAIEAALGRDDTEGTYFKTKRQRLDTQSPFKVRRRSYTITFLKSLLSYSKTRCR